MSIYFKQNENHISIMGQTYPHRQAIKAMGAVFVGDRKIWRVPYSEEVLKQVAELCATLGGGAIDQPQETADLAVIPEPMLKAAQIEGASADGAPVVEKSGYKVSQLMEMVQGALQERFPLPVWIMGEIQNISQKNGTYYLTLAETSDGKSQGTVTVSATIWGGVANSLCKKHGETVVRDLLQDGLSVRLLCQVTLYRGRGSISLNVMDIDTQFTQGVLALAREMLLKELRAKGLDQTNKRVPLPAFPLRIGLVTAEESRAQNDFLHQLQEGKFPGTILFAPASMQGETTTRTVMMAIQKLVDQNCDVIVLTRGGGSAADLRWFDDPQLAYAIAACPRPIVAAIGHHDDFCVVEEISFLRRKTPTAAADFILERCLDIRTRLQNASNYLQDHLNRTLQRKTDQIVQTSERLQISSTRALTRKSEGLQRLLLGLSASVHNGAARKHQMLTQLAARLPTRAMQRCEQLSYQGQRLGLHLARNAQTFFNNKERILLQAESRLGSADPRPWLAKGWTQLWGDDGLVTSVLQVQAGSPIRARLKDGGLDLTVQQIRNPQEE